MTSSCVVCSGEPEHKLPISWNYIWDGVFAFYGLPDCRARWVVCQTCILSIRVLLDIELAIRRVERPSKTA